MVTSQTGAAHDFTWKFSCRCISLVICWIQSQLADSMVPSTPVAPAKSEAKQQRHMHACYSPDQEHTALGRRRPTYRPLSSPAPASPSHHLNLNYYSNSHSGRSIMDHPSFVLKAPLLLLVCLQRRAHVPQRWWLSSTNGDRLERPKILLSTASPNKRISQSW
jgi:hypothetical protein